MEKPSKLQPEAESAPADQFETRNGISGDGNPQLRPRTLAEIFRDVIGKAQGLPADMAEHHDHYLYGTPKR